MSYAQGSKQQASSSETQQIFRECLKLFAEVQAKEAEIAALKRQNASLEEIRKAQDEKIALGEQALAVSDKVIERLEAAGEKSNQIIGELRSQNQLLRDDLERTRKERDRANSRLKKALATGAAVGALVVAGLVAIFK